MHMYGIDITQSKFFKNKSLAEKKYVKAFYELVFFEL